ncbi:MAG TPA: TIGR04211 family SH3 domain-containing protein [Steroidobacteraceae bacterium]|nr:TIGR04211 family SH3 domain-containing protein [Steroidobacteraceae bacterium]
MAVSARVLLVLAASLPIAPAARAETLYVIEQLVVSLSSAPDSSGQKVGTLHSGDAVEVLDRQGDQIQVRLGNGTEGWVRKSYLSAEQPLQRRLSERTAEVDKLKQDVTRLQAELAALRSQSGGSATSRGNSANGNTGTRSGGPDPAGAGASKATAVSSNGAESNAGNAASPGESARGHDPDAAVDPSTREPSFFMTPPDEPARPVWHWAVGSFVVALVLGFVLGWQVLDRRIRRKYGGLRIY